MSSINNDDYLLDDMNKYSDRHKKPVDNLITDKFGPDDANKVNRIIYKLNRKICGRVCTSPYLHGLYFIKEIMAQNCLIYCEIGVLFGGSMALVMQLPFKTTFIGIDIFDSYYQNGPDTITGITPHPKITQHNIDLFNHHKHPYYLIKGDSKQSETLTKLDNILKDRTIDLLLIDGDHTYQGVTQDFLNYGPKVSLGGYLMFDNYSQHTWLGVKKAIDEIDFTKYGYSEICCYGEYEREGVGSFKIYQRTSL